MYYERFRHTNFKTGARAASASGSGIVLRRGHFGHRDRRDHPARGVAKQSLYNNFASKAELVATYLEHRHAEWLGLYEKRLEKAAGPMGGLLAVFDAYRDHAEFAYEHGFRGCGLLNAAAELPAGDPGREAVRKHKEEVEGLLVTHLTGLIPDDPPRVRQLAVQLSFILEGAIMRAGLEGNSARLGEARAMVATILKPV